MSPTPGCGPRQSVRLLSGSGGAGYAKVTRDYSALRAHYFKALAADPVGIALAALAVGSTGWNLMELGRRRAFGSEARSKRERPVRGRRDTYNCHHVVIKRIRRSPPEFKSITQPILWYAKRPAEVSINRGIHIISGTARFFILKWITPRPSLSRSMCPPAFPILSADHPGSPDRRRNSPKAGLPGCTAAPGGLGKPDLGIFESHETPAVRRPKGIS